MTYQYQNKSNQISFFYVEKNILKDSMKEEMYLLLLSGNEIIVDDIVFKKITASNNSNIKEPYKGFHFPKGIDATIKDKIATACEYKLNVLAIYNEGYKFYPNKEDVDAICSEDGLTHIYAMDHTKGAVKIPMALEAGRTGGHIFIYTGLKELWVI